MVENCLRPNGLPTQTGGSGFGTRLYCRSGSAADDARQILGISMNRIILLAGLVLVHDHTSTALLALPVLFKA